MNLAIFGSTKGTDLQAVIDALKSGVLNGVDLKFVFSNKQDAYILERARVAGFKTIFLDPKGKTREEYDAECLRLCQEHHIDLILFIGYMRLVTKTLIEPYRNKILNIHPSLLPKYPGMDLDVHKAVLDAKELETGCTLHFVDEGTDTGPIFIQRKLAINPGETPETLKKRVQKLEQEVILEGIVRFIDVILEGAKRPIGSTNNFREDSIASLQNDYVTTRHHLSLQ